MAVRAFISGCSGLDLTGEERVFFAEAEPWGLILFRRNIGDHDQIRRLCADFRAAVGRPEAPVLIDQEGGRVQRIRPPLCEAHPPAARYGALYASDAEGGLAAARLGAALMAAELAALGINVDCAPVLDLPAEGMTDAIGDRAYAFDADAVAALGRAVVEGMLGSGVLPVIKHMPGHGRATVDSHYHLPRVAADRATLEASDFRPFQALVDAPLAMTGHILFEAIDPERPATLSPTVISEIIRGHIGYDGLLMTDDISMKALSGSVGDSARAAIEAGCDLALHCNGDMGEMREVAAAAPRLEGRPAERAAVALDLLKASRPVETASADLAALAAERDRLLQGALA